jgi:subtilisin family serine protease
MKAKQRFYQLLISCLLVTISAYSQVTSQEKFIPGETLIQLKPGTDVSKFTEHANSGSGLQLQPERLISKSFNIWLFKFEPSISKDLLLQKLYAQKEVVKAQMNHIPEERVINTPNDTYFTNQWNMLNTGQNGGLPGADIDATLAWNITTGGLTFEGDTIVVCVVDGGVALNHPDLDHFKNRNEIPGNSIDDDNNGYIDDYDGWNAYNHTGNISNNNHGTHVSGIVGAKGNNGIGVAGVNWKVKIMTVMGSTTSEAVAIEAYTYVYDMRKLYNETNGQKGAFVVSTNSSFGVDNGQPSNFPLWCAMYDSLGRVGILSATATANQGWNIDQTGDIPTACPSDYMISVTNTTSTDSKYAQAGYGATTIDLGAPGTTIYSTTWPSSSPSYGNMTGTSMASPHVAGAVGLMMAAADSEYIANYKIYPDSFALIAKKMILANVDVIPALQNITVSNGRLNLYRSVSAIADYDSTFGVGVSSFDFDAKNIINLFPNPANTSLTIINSINSELKLYDVTGQLIMELFIDSDQFTIQLDELKAGVYFVSCSDRKSVRTAKLIKD